MDKDIVTKVFRANKGWDSSARLIIQLTESFDWGRIARADGDDAGDWVAERFIRNHEHAREEFPQIQWVDR